MYYSDNVLIDELKAKNDKALEIMYEKFFPKVFNYVFSQVGGRSKAEQLTEEIFVDLVKGLNEYPYHLSLTQWLYRLTRRRLAQLAVRPGPREDQGFMFDSPKTMEGFFKFEEALLNGPMHR